MIRKFIPSTIFLLFLISTGFSQNDYRNSVFLEVGGSGYFGSINYERTITKDANVRIGFLFISDVVIVPLTMGKLYGHSSHKFELAGGITFARNPNEYKDDEEVTGVYLLLTGFVGYRYQPMNRRILFRAGLTPLLSFYDNTSDAPNLRLEPWAGVSCGWRF